MRQRLFSPRVKVKSFEALNAWLEDRCVAAAKAHRHPEVQDKTIWGMFETVSTTNAIEALNSKIRRAVRTRGHFPSDEAAARLICLALNAASPEWTRSVRDWHAVKSQIEPSEHCCVLL